MRKDLRHPFSDSWLDNDRIWCTRVSSGLTFFKQSLCGSASKDNTKEAPKMYFFSRKGLVICMSSFTLCLFSSPREAVSCPCFQSDMRMSYLSEGTGHWPAAVHPEIRSQMTSPKPNTQTRTNCVWILSRLWEIVKVCSPALHSGNTSSVQGKGSIESLVSVLLEAQKTPKDGKPALQIHYAKGQTAWWVGRNPKHRQQRTSSI